MAYSRWATVEELKSRLAPISYDSDIKKSGVPMIMSYTFENSKLKNALIWLPFSIFILQEILGYFGSFRRCNYV